ncbi:unnamed protein product [Rotaria sordida]|uniref:Fe2OG dioxygenase domain-containing protein n=2 Tax=Rotaria sordida TaxID=392033 RepID=A0A818KR88_9BILA|nr:unnamed protein product [Rotaria sordida]
MEIYKLTNVPDTLYYIPNFITIEEEEYLLSCVNNVPRTRWVQLRNRRLQNWGGQPHSKGMIQTESLPKWLEPFTERILKLENQTIFPDHIFQFNHCLVNEYESGQGIMPHTDGPVYHPIVSTISLQSHTVIEFYRPIDSNNKEDVSSFSDRCIARVLLEPRSLFMVKDDMYSYYLHGIEERQEDTINRERISNFDRCNDNIKDKDEQILLRTTRISLTIRCVEKISKLPMLILRQLIFRRSLVTLNLQCRSCLFRLVTFKKQQYPIQLSSKFVLPRTEYSFQCKSFSSISSDQQKTDRIWTIPNILTFARIGTSPILGYLIINHHYTMSLSLFIISGLTDLIDGWIARRYPSQSSALGSFLDPFADKMLVGFVVISLAYVNLIPLWLLALILSRDIAIMCVAGYLRIKSVPPPRTLKKILNMKNATVQLYPTFVSKVNTGVQIGLLALCMAAPIFDYHNTGWMSVIYTLSALSTGVSWLSYVGKSGRSTFKMLSQQTKPPHSSSL